MIITDIKRQDQYGFYQCGKFRSYSKLEIMHEHHKTKLPVIWNFNDKVYSALNWQVEPSESLAELYKRRAQQIRDNYDYIVLWLSGGADSANILDIFTENDIHLDECASFVNYEATGSKTNMLNGEVFHVAPVMVEHARKKNPTLKHRVVDLSNFVIDHYTNSKAKIDWIYHQNTFMSPNNLARHDIKLKVQEWTAMFDAGKRVAFVHGIDKPRIFQHHDHYYSYFVDIIDTSHSPSHQMQNRPWDFDELFYWSRDAPLIPIKQAHVLKNYVKSLAIGDPNATGEKHGLCKFVQNNIPRELVSEKINELVYPAWRKVPFQAKTPSTFFSPKDDWFFKLPDTDIVKQRWKIGLEELWRNIPDDWKKNPNSMYNGMGFMSSKVYDVGT